MPGKLLRGRTCGSTGPQRGGPAAQCSLKIIQEFSETSFSDTAVIMSVLSQYLNISQYSDRSVVAV